MHLRFRSMVHFLSFLVITTRSFASTVYFQVAELPFRVIHGDSYVLPLDNPVDIAHAERLRMARANRHYIPEQGTAQEMGRRGHREEKNPAPHKFNGGSKMKRLLSYASIGLFSFLLLASTVSGETSKQAPQTLLGISGFTPKPARLSESVLVIIDAQREYVDGKLRLEGIDASLKEASLLLERARKAGTPVIHVVHKGKPGGALFNPDGPFVEIAAPVTPKPGETIVTKALPNAFANTNLEDTLSRIGRKNLIIIGYMTHMCVSSTVRAALDRGYRTTVVAKATATRNLPAVEGGEVPAQMLQRASLAALADRFGTVVQGVQDIPE